MMPITYLSYLPMQEVFGGHGGLTFLLATWGAAKTASFLYEKVDPRKMTKKSFFWHNEELIHPVELKERLFFEPASYMEQNWDLWKVGPANWLRMFRDNIRNKFNYLRSSAMHSRLFKAPEDAFSSVKVPYNPNTLLYDLRLQHLPRRIWEYSSVHGARLLFYRLASASAPRFNIWWLLGGYLFAGYTLHSIVRHYHKGSHRGFDYKTYFWSTINGPTLERCIDQMEKEVILTKAYRMVKELQDVDHQRKIYGRYPEVREASVTKRVSLNKCREALGQPIERDPV